MSEPIFSLDVRRARKGDCLLLHYGTREEPGLIMIDGGPDDVYTPHLKPRLDAIRKARGLAADAALPVDLLMVSHIDDDHIQGILDLAAELVESTDEKRPLSVKVRTLWHNTFDDIIGNDPAKLLASVTAAFGEASLHGGLETEGFEEHTAKVLASVNQGRTLRDNARRLKWTLNNEFKGDVIMTADGKALDMKKGLKFTVVGPMKTELAALQKEHDKTLEKAKTKEGKASLASFTDDSVANLSSIVVLAKVGEKSMLLTGDARGDIILKGLEQTKQLKDGKMHVDLLKVPHHGSDRNMKTSFFEVVTADHYVFSGNGEHGNPERETLQMLLDARGDAKFTIHLTYPIDEIDEERKAEAKKKKKTFTDAKHSLKSFFEANPGFAAKVKIVDETKAHLIDLLEKVTF